jgi:hypothetical protein
MKPIIPLRPLLWFDAATCAAMALALIGAAGPLAAITGLPPMLLTGAAAILIPFALFVAVAAAQRAPEKPARVVIAANMLWVAASLAVLGTPSLQPTTLGAALVIAQTSAVAALVLFQWLALKREPASA